MHKHSTKLFVVVSIALVAMLVTAGTVFANGPGNPDSSGDGVTCQKELPNGKTLETDNHASQRAGENGCPPPFEAAFDCGAIDPQNPPPNTPPECLDSDGVPDVDDPCPTSPRCS